MKIDDVAMEILNQMRDEVFRRCPLNDDALTVFEIIRGELDIVIEGVRNDVQQEAQRADPS